MTEAFTPPEPGAPSDYTTVVDVLNELVAEGFVESFGVTRDGRVRCSNCGHVEDPSGMGMHRMRRLEGASDPDDEVAVLGLECCRCHARGTLVMKYGPGSTEEELAVLAAVEDDRRA